ncbi:hypothetical protein RSC2_03716 [Bacillus paralicheniformis]|nr:hypothetical protein LI6934_22980 [Bacillus licheniformis LMG 6934]TWJ60546.1 hypothetical protein CHCC5023_4535 [Bacillus paralicheniformis]TWJ82155.1 hypothetical protein CHCC5019_1037 [Bacillus paralicheniformis]TWK37678.1 hypothetical protein CHCC20348_4444 [Bacillus paralicheniformis]TWN99567.1 hypothetical protein CHCC20490_3844 [Bacillus paralicheniformis]
MKDDNLKDRGSIKWTAMMLPEHVGLLHELESNQDKVKGRFLTCLRSRIWK